MHLPLRELLAVDERGALQFFFAGLKDVSAPHVDQQELLYNASVLAHYSQVSSFSDTDFPAPQTLSMVFDNFVMDTGSPLDVTMMETAGSHCLLMTGFFGDQMRCRHSLRWYSDLGAGFFFRASALESEKRKAALLLAISEHFDAWRHRYARLSRELRDLPYLLKVPNTSRTE